MSQSDLIEAVLAGASSSLDEKEKEIQAYKGQIAYLEAEYGKLKQKKDGLAWTYVALKALINAVEMPEEPRQLILKLLAEGEGA